MNTTDSKATVKLDFSNPMAPECVREMEKHARFSAKNIV